MPAPQTLSGKDYERSVALARSGKAEIEPVTAKPPAVYVPPDPETLGVTRRQFLNRSIVGFMVMSLSGFGAAVIARLGVSLYRPLRCTCFRGGDKWKRKTTTAGAGSS